MGLTWSPVRCASSIARKPISIANAHGLVHTIHKGNHGSVIFPLNTEPREFLVLPNWSRIPYVIVCICAFSCGHLCVDVLQIGLNQHPYTLYTLPLYTYIHTYTLYAYVMHVATHCTNNSPTTNRFRVTTAVPTVLFAVHVYIPLLLLTTGLMVRTDPLTPSVTGTLSFRNV